jgi:hypothetical protein
LETFFGGALPAQTVALIGRRIANFFAIAFAWCPGWIAYDRSYPYIDGQFNNFREESHEENTALLHFSPSDLFIRWMFGGFQAGPTGGTAPNPFPGIGEECKTVYW